MIFFRPKTSLKSSPKDTVGNWLDCLRAERLIPRFATAYSHKSTIDKRTPIADSMSMGVCDTAPKPSNAAHGVVCLMILVS